MTKITESERKALEGILNSDFMDGATGTDRVGKQVWTWSANPFPSKRTFSGVVASLVKKGLAVSTDEGRDSVIWITQLGLDALEGSTNEPTDRVNLLTTQAAKANAEGPKLTTYSIYYMRPEFFRDGSMGSEWLAERKRMPDAGDLLRTHVYLREIEARDLDHAYHLMQGEVWSPNGEARGLIAARGLQHTSMSMGDVLVDQGTFEAYMVDRFGFHQLTRFELPAIGPSAD